MKKNVIRTNMHCINKQCKSTPCIATQYKGPCVHTVPIEPSEQDNAVEQPKAEVTISNEEITRQILRETNKYRHMHCACRLVINTRLSQYAQVWADKLAASGRLETRPLPKYGENIISCRTELFDVPRLIKLWYQEKYFYKYADPKFSPYTGHFTQMVWWETKELGVGIARSDGRILIVCNYRPSGNIRGHYKENVLPRKLMLSSSESESQMRSKKKRVTSTCASKILEPPPPVWCEVMRRKCTASPEYYRFKDKEKEIKPLKAEVEKKEVKNRLKLLFRKS